jgi:outer membrane protein assembly factor BamB
VAASPALVQGRLYVAASEGPLVALDAESGKKVWSFDLTRMSNATPMLLSAPMAIFCPKKHMILVYLGAELKNPISSAAFVYCLGDEAHRP